MSTFYWIIIISLGLITIIALFLSVYSYTATKKLYNKYLSKNIDKDYDNLAERKRKVIRKYGSYNIDNILD